MNHRILSQGWQGNVKNVSSTFLYFNKIVHKATYVSPPWVGGPTEKLLSCSCFIQFIGNTHTSYCHTEYGLSLFIKNKPFFWPFWLNVSSRFLFFFNTNFQINLFGHFIFTCLVRSLALFCKCRDILNTNSNNNNNNNNNKCV